QHISKYPDVLELAGATDLDLSRATAFCEQFGGKVYPSFEDVLADPAVDVVLNLTVHRIHFELNCRALRAGKHVFSEKPMAMSYAEARELCDLARQMNRRMAAAPITYLGEGMQTTARLLDRAPVGQIRLVYAEVNW